MNRRSVLTGFAAVGAAPLMLSRMSPSLAAGPEVGPMADPAGAKTAADFFKAVIPRAEISLVTSQMAVDMARNANAKEFAGFELGEAIAVDMVIKDMDITSPVLGADATALFASLKSAGESDEFDRTYIAFQLANHEYLRNLADGYLHNTVASSDMAEKHGRHLASLMLGVFKEHTAICKRISGELGA